MTRFKPSHWLLLALFLHLVAAIFSVGYYHSDEHFQILEFMSFKLGHTPAEHLSLEFHQMLRPWLQPALYFGIARVLGIQSPFAQTFAFRLFSALVGWCSLAALLLASRRWLAERAFAIACAASALLWYLPAFHTRVSSENLSGAVFFIAMGLLFLGNGAALTLGCGFLLGLSFEFRYQLGFMIAGLVLWLALSRKSPFRSARVFRLTALAAGLLLALALGLVIDRWGYGQWTFAPWNYLRYNLIQNHVADIDSQPVWDFFRSSFTETWPPLGWLCLVAFVLAWIRYPKHPLTWATLPLFAVHCLIGHKELRFLFPIAHAGPILIAMAIPSRAPGARETPLALLSRFASFFLVLDNLVALAALCLVPAWMPARFYEEIAARSRGTPLTLYYRDRNPYEILGVSVDYYRPAGLTLARLDDFKATLAAHPEGIFLFDTQPLAEANHPPLPGCELRYSTLPLWLSRYGLEGATHRLTDWILYECKGTAG